MWGFKGKARQKFAFPELEKKLQESRRAAEQTREALREKSDSIIHRKDMTKKMTGIRDRNKERTILVIKVEDKHSPVVSSLLKANSNAIATFARSIKEAIAMMKQCHYDMVYLVTQIRKGPNCSGPCFFSMQQDKEHVDRYGNLVREDLSTLAPYHNGAEIVVVCAGQECPTDVFGENPFR